MAVRYETSARTAAQWFALILGLLYLVVGVLGFIPGITSAPGADARELTLDANYGLLFGLFPVNILHNIVHLVIGLWGLVAFRSADASRTFAKVVGVLFVILAIMGLIPGLDTTFGLIPLFGHVIWLHAVTGLLGLYFGFAGRSADRV